MYLSKYFQNRRIYYALFDLNKINVFMFISYFPKLPFNTLYYSMYYQGDKFLYCNSILYVALQAASPQYYPPPENNNFDALNVTLIFVLCSLSSLSTYILLKNNLFLTKPFCYGLQGEAKLLRRKRLV